MNYLLRTANKTGKTIEAASESEAEGCQTNAFASLELQLVVLHRNRRPCPKTTGKVASGKWVPTHLPDTTPHHTTPHHTTPQAENVEASSRGTRQCKVKRPWQVPEVINVRAIVPGIGTIGPHCSSTTVFFPPVQYCTGYRVEENDSWIPRVHRSVWSVAFVSAHHFIPSSLARLALCLQLFVMASALTAPAVVREGSGPAPPGQPLGAFAQYVHQRRRSLASSMTANEGLIPSVAPVRRPRAKSARTLPKAVQEEQDPIPP